MATLDNINLFAVGGATDDTQDPLYPEYLALVEQFEAMKDMPTIPGGYPDAPSFAQFKRQKEAEVARNILAENLESGDIKKAYEEGFTQLPIAEQLGVYINPITGVPVETYETGYFADEAGFQMKKPGEALLDLVNPLSSPLEKLPFTAEDPISAVLAPLSAAGALGGIGELANIPKAGLMALRRYQQKSMDGGGGGGIGGLPKPQQETTKDLAGYKSNVYEEAKAVADELSPKALLQYLKSNKRTNPQNNKLGIGLKQTELDEIDLDAFEAQYPNKDFTNEELLQYVNDNRVQLYRVSRSEDPMYRGGDGDDKVDVYLDEPLTYEYRMDTQNAYDMDYRNYITKQIDFLDEHFPEGVINKQNYDAFVQKQRDFIQRRDIDTSGQAPSQLINEFLIGGPGYDNPYRVLGDNQFEYITPDGTLIQDLPSETRQVLGQLTESEGLDYLLERGYSLKPKILDEDIDKFTELAAETKVDLEYEDGLGQEAYRYVGPNDIYEIVGSEADGYNIRINGEFADDMPEYIPLDEARIQIEQRELAEGNISGLGKYDSYNSDKPLIDVLPRDVIYGDATIPTKYDDFERYRLPMGGATDYEEHTIHIKNPKTATRYSGDKGTKHFGGGDELFHIRTSVRTDENGKKVLFVEEIQSDLHSTARSTQEAATYETTPQQKREISQNMQKIDPRIEFGQLNKDFPDSDDYVRFGFDEDAMLIPVSQVRRLAQDENLDSFTTLQKKGELKIDDTTPGGLKQLDYILKNISPEQLKDVAKQLDSYTFGTLPNFPYKKDWVDLAVKEAMKLGAEKNVDRIAFTNAPAQVKRNNKSVYYNQDIIVETVPTKQEIKNSKEFAEKVQEERNGAYIDFTNYAEVPISNTSKYKNLPIPSQEEFFADMPIKKRRVNALNKQSTKIIDDMYKLLAKDLEKFKQKYPEVSEIFIESELDGSARGILKSYELMREAELSELSRRANLDLDITADPRNVDVTNPALARLLDADLDFRQMPESIDDSVKQLREIADERNYLNSFLEYDLEKIKEKTLNDLMDKYGTGRYKYKLEKVGYPVEGDELLNPQKIQLEGDDYDMQRYGTRMLDGEEALAVELGEELGPKTIEKLQSGKSQVVIPKDELEGSGMKFLEIYKNEIPRGINKVLKDLKVKDVKPSISDVLFSKEDIDSDIILQQYIKQKNASIDEFGLTDTVFDAQVETHSSIGIDLTDDMKRKILQEGLNNMYMGGKVSKSNSMDRPIAGNVREM
jgi:hypothetical protein